MNIFLHDYDPDFLEAQVELGSKIMEDWKYNSQSSLEHLQKVYTGDNFQPHFKIYAFDIGNKLVGFQTSHHYKDGNKNHGRLEFPISSDDLVVEKLQEETEKRFKEVNPDFLRVRVSPYWGKTEEYAEKFGFEFEKPHIMTSEVSVNELHSIEEEDRFEEISMLSQDNDTRKMANTFFKEIFPQRFPMRYEGEIDQWISYYYERAPFVWSILVEEGKPIGNIIGFQNEDVLSLTSFFSLGSNPEVELQTLINYVISKISKNEEISRVRLTIGDNQVPYSKALDKMGLSLETQVSYYTKSKI